jgi:hypothetical protein
MSKKPSSPQPTRIGRPRLYDTPAEKLEAFRQRQQSAGYLRREVLVTEEVALQLSRLAKQNGVSVTDVASGMLEYGLERYDEAPGSSTGGSPEAAGTMPEALAGGAAVVPAAVPPSALAPGTAPQPSMAAPRSAATLAAAPMAAAPAAESTLRGSADNPITQFFRRRKGESA